MACVALFRCGIPHPVPLGLSTQKRTHQMTHNAKKTALLISGIITGISLLILAANAVFKVSLLSANAAYIDPSDKPLVAAGQVVYQVHCASCHGTQLQGEANWRVRKPNGRLPAPPHDASGHTWHHADALLIDITKNGLVPGVTAPAGYRSDMPAYKEQLSKQDIRAVLAYIKSSWPQQALQQQKELTLRQ